MDRGLGRVMGVLAATWLVAWAGAAAAQGGAPLAAQGCLGCHGPNAGAQAAVPSLGGRPAAETEAQMRAFRTGEAPATIMGRIARGYTDAEIAAIAAFFAAQPR